MHDFDKFPELNNSQMITYYLDSPHKQIVENFRAKCVKIHDGDTITLRWFERDFDFPIRLINIAAPELSEQGGYDSQGWLEDLILNEEVDIIINPQNRVDKWGRLLGNVVFNGTDVGEDEIQVGHAIPWAQVKEQNPIPDFDKEMAKVEATWS